MKVEGGVDKHPMMAHARFARRSWSDFQNRLTEVLEENLG